MMLIKVGDRLMTVEQVNEHVDKLQKALARALIAKHKAERDLANQSIVRVKKTSLERIILKSFFDQR